MESRFLDLLGQSIANDHSRQVTPHYFTERLFREKVEISRVLDLGCGSGTSLEYFLTKRTGLKWVGLDISESPEAASHIGGRGEYRTYDGIHIPYADGYFDLIYCRQVLEHVRHPTTLLRDACRVLKPGGYFVGSTSHLEPYHALSVWNYTPYGFCLLITDAGMRVIELRPGIDALTLIVRRGFRGSRLFASWWDRESPLNLAIGFAGKAMRKQTSWINAAKLVFCGQFSFLVRKDESPAAKSRRA